MAALFERACTILVIGFETPYGTHLLEGLKHYGASARFEDGQAIIDQPFVAGEASLVVVDFDGSPIYAPKLIADFRGAQANKSSPYIASLGRLVLPGFETQLRNAGCDFVLERPIDPVGLAGQLAELLLGAEG